MSYEDELKSRRPSLVKLTDDKGEIRDALLQGFDSREAILFWLQKVCVRTLGEIPDRFVEAFSREFKPRRTDGQMPTLMAALHTPYARNRDDIDDEAARELRRRLATEYIEPASVRAFNRLRERATEYVGESDDETDYDPQKQRYIAMRPVLDELEQTQQDCLQQLLDGFDDKDELVRWFDVLQLATHGEVDSEFLTRCYKEKSTRKMLLGDEEKHKRAREVFAAEYILPLFNAGVRDLSGRATEQPDADSDDITPTQA